MEVQGVEANDLMAQTFRRSTAQPLRGCTDADGSDDGRRPHRRTEPARRRDRRGRRSYIVRREHAAAGLFQIFTKLNDIKPAMIADATKNARASAQQFAAIPGSSAWVHPPGLARAVPDSSCAMRRLGRAKKSRFEDRPRRLDTGLFTDALSAASAIHFRDPWEGIVLGRFSACILIPVAAMALFAADEKVSFNRDIRPIMAETCFRCHGPDKSSRMAGMRLDLRDEALKPKRTGVAPIVPGDPDEERDHSAHLRQNRRARHAARRSRTRN